MKEIKEQIIKEAIDKHKVIHPPSSRTDLMDCFTTEDDYLFFWFNTADQSTRVIAKKVK